MKGLRNRLRCSIVRFRLPGSILDGVPLGDAQQVHVEGCLNCQADQAALRSLGRGLALLATEEFAVPTSLVPSVMRRLDNPMPARRRSPFNLGFALAAGAVVGIGWALRARSPRSA